MPNNMKKAGKKYKYGSAVYNKKGQKVPGMYQEGGENEQLQLKHEARHTGFITDKKEHNWNEKLNRLTAKRKKRKGKGKGTKNIQRRINKEYKKINP